VKDFRDLKVWEKAHHLTLDVYKATSSFPREELYGLTRQLRRCSASVAANLAEGCGKRGNNEFQRYLQIASGSARTGLSSAAFARLEVPQPFRLRHPG
jgi:four helix bundle protein